MDANKHALAGAVLYVDLMSQPSRACVYFAHLCKLSVTTKLTTLGKKEQRTPEYLAMNPLGQVPFLREADGFGLPESSAILKYLADRHHAHVADHWYPANLRARAKVGGTASTTVVHYAPVNAALDWYHGTIRRGAAGVTWNALIAKNMGMKLSHETARSMLGVLKGSLKTLEAAWLKAEGGAFMMGAEDPCIADLLVAEVGDIFNLVLLEAVDNDFGMPASLDALLGDGHPNVRRFLAAVRGLDPAEWGRLHAVLDKAKKRMVERKLSGDGGGGGVAKL